MKIHCQGRTDSQGNNVYFLFYFNYLYIIPNFVMRHFGILIAFLKSTVASVNARGCVRFLRIMWKESSNKLVTNLNLQIELFTKECVIVPFGGIWQSLKQWYLLCYCFLQIETFPPGGKKEAPRIQGANKTEEAQVTRKPRKLKLTDFPGPSQSYKIRKQL